jgi:hypothetical protein
MQVNMKADLREMYGASTRAAAEAAINVFADKYGAKYEKAVDGLTKDREALLAFFDFPAEHWDHLRTSNSVESVFATVRHEMIPVDGQAMVFKLVTAAAKTWRRLKGENQLPKSRPRSQISKRASRSSKCRLTTSPDRPRYPISLIAHPHPTADHLSGGSAVARRRFRPDALRTLSCGAQSPGAPSTSTHVLHSESNHTDPTRLGQR